MNFYHVLGFTYLAAVTSSFFIQLAAVNIILNKKTVLHNPDGTEFNMGPLREANPMLLYTGALMYALADPITYPLNFLFGMKQAFIEGVPHARLTLQ